MHRTCPIPISSSAPVASNGSPISSCGRRLTASSYSCRPIGRISIALRWKAQSSSIAGVDAANRPLRARALRSSELMLRVCSALVLVPLAIGTAYLGGWPFALFWGAAALGVLWEWISLVAPSEERFMLLTGGAALALAVALAGMGHAWAAVVV